MKFFLVQKFAQMFEVGALFVGQRNEVQLACLAGFQKQIFNWRSRYMGGQALCLLASSPSHQTSYAAAIDFLILRSN